MNSDKTNLQNYVKKLRRYLRPETMLLLRMYISEEAISFSQLAKDTHVPRSAVVKHLKSLTQEGTVSSYKDPSHQQRKLYTINDNSRDTVQHLLNIDDVSNTYANYLEKNRK